MNNKLKIINFLGKMNNCEFTMHKLSNELNIPYATFYRTIERIRNLVNLRVLGKSKIISLNKNYKSIKSYLVVSSEEERNEFLENNLLINKLYNEIDTNDIVILFGSYAKGNPRKDSDVDLMIVNKKGKKTLSFSKYELIFNKKINPIFFSYEEFKLMLKDKEENVGKQALKYHILLNNSENFWELVLNE